MTSQEEAGLFRHEQLICSEAFPSEHPGTVMCLDEIWTVFREIPGPPAHSVYTLGVGRAEGVGTDDTGAG